MRFDLALLLLFFWVGVDAYLVKRNTVEQLNEQNCIVSTESNEFHGYLATTYDSKVSYCSFLGIKYATAERFKEAVLYSSPNKVVEVVKDGPACVQIHGNSIIGDEDCLLLSVHSPNVNGSLPVLVYIHGGGFAIGTSKITYQKPDFFMETQKVVMVFIQYRLGALGFVDFNSDEFPSNLGLKDQVLALKWVKNNIAKFGGNPDEVTIQGESAGGASISLLLFSPLAKGLFRAGISESGCACASWAVLPKAWARTRLRLLTANAGCSVTDIPEMDVEPADLTARCLKLKSAQELINATKTFAFFNGMNSFLPVLEKASAKNPFLTFIPWSGPTNQVPWISGVNSNEAGILLKIMGQLNKGSGPPTLSVNLSRALYYDYTTSHPEDVTNIIEEHYKFHMPVDVKHAEGATKAVTDGTFAFPNYQCQRVHSGSSSYNYYFNYVATAQRNRPIKGVFHTEELQYLFIRNISNIRVTGSKSDIEMSHNMVDLWVSFVEASKPSTANITWDAYDPKENQVLVIDETGFNMDLDPNLQDNIFWGILPWRNLMP